MRVHGDRCLCIALILGVAFLAACGGQMPKPTPSLVRLGESPTIMSPANESGPVPEIAVPTPSLGLGIVHGRLIRTGQGPVANTAVYLAEVVQAESGETQNALLVTQPGKSPRAVTNEDGYFVFVDVEPGTYGLFVSESSDASSLYVRDEITLEARLFEIGADSVADMGEIVIDVP